MKTITISNIHPWFETQRPERYNVVYMDFNFQNPLKRLYIFQLTTIHDTQGAKDVTLTLMSLFITKEKEIIKSLFFHHKTLHECAITIPILYHAQRKLLNLSL